MRQRLGRLDDILIDIVCQPVVDWIDQMVAFNCFRIARFLLDLAAFAWILSQAESAVTAARTGLPGLATFQFTLIVVGLGAITVLRSIFNRGGDGGSTRQGGLQNPLRPGMFTHRLTCLVWMLCLLLKTALAPANFGSGALLAVGTFATAALYLGACSKPPSKRRECGSEFWRGFGITE